MSSEHPIGRRPGDPEVTRAAVLDAARSMFAEHGFEKATIRAIAAEASVDPALVLHYFGSKDKLFVSAHQLPFSPEDVESAIFDSDLDGLGERIARFYLSALAVPGSPAVSLLRATATHEEAAEMLRTFIDLTLMGPGLETVPGPDRRFRMSLVASHLLGVLFGRLILGIPELAESDLEDIIRPLATTFQRYLTDQI
ncbi:MAG: TetR family transcriptional regulator [Actinomycetota bacterium]|nr:TetR family transcriptional regulator [Actinomycetota bacterium]